MSSQENGAEDRAEVAPEHDAGGTLAIEIVEDAPAPGEEESPEDLMRECADLQDTQAWERFMLRFNPRIVAMVARTMRRYGFDGAGLNDDLVQEVYVKLSAHQARVLRKFKSRYPRAVYGYLKVIAANVVHDYFKSKSGSHPHDAPLPDDLAEKDRTEWRLFLRDIDDVLKKPPTSERDRQIFWLYYRQGMSAKEIAGLSSLKLTVKGVESVIMRLNQLVRSAFSNGKR
jgi:RNA polymerase sigma-70 factor (ECF subfamily)